MNSLNLLLVQGSPEDAEFLVGTLRSGSYEPVFERVETAEALRIALKTPNWEAVISDYTLPDFSALRALEVLKETGSDIPFIIVSGAVGEAVAVALLKAGAQDFLLKNDIDRLVPTLDRELNDAKLRRERRAAAEVLRETVERLQTFHDIDRAILTRQPLAVMANLVLDYFVSHHAAWAAVLVVFDLEAQDAVLYTAFHDPAVQRLIGVRVPLADVAPEEVDQLMKGGIHAAETTSMLLKPAFDSWELSGGSANVSASSPLMADGLMLGSLLLLSDRPDGFGAAALETVREIADQTAIGIHQMRLQEKIARDLQDLEARVQERTLALNESEQRYRLLAEDAQKALGKEIELNELKTRFVSMVSHDFRTPLSVILSSIGILDRYADRLNDERRTKHFDTIRGQIRRMANLLDDVLIITKADSGAMPLNPAAVNLDVLCRSIASEFQNSPDIKHTVVYTCWSEQNEAAADERMLVQAISNLLTNAIKYSPEGTEVRFDLNVGAESAVLTVSDSGIGIPEADRHRLFEAFNRASNVGTIQGTGLGLAIVQRVIDAHHGTISLESEVGIGTTFVVTLPLTQPEKSGAV